MSNEPKELTEEEVYEKLLMENEVKPPIIAVIVSNRLRNCHDFLRVHGLSPRLFLVANDFSKLQGLNVNTPIIGTHGYYELPWDVRNDIVDRFNSFRYIDY
jgi:hypothetical protein